MNPYASQLGNQDPMRVLESTTSQLTEISNSLAGRIEQPLAPGKWSPREVFIHLTDCEIAFGFRYRQALGEERYIVQPFDQDKWAKTYAAYSAEQALATFGVLRSWNLALLRRLTPDQLAKPMTHPERGQETVKTLIEITAGHDINHLQRLKAIIAKPAA
jgi:hypothetical protein